MEPTNIAPIEIPATKYCQNKTTSLCHNETIFAAINDQRLIRITQIIDADKLDTMPTLYSTVNFLSSFILFPRDNSIFYLIDIIRHSADNSFLR
ncbi:hypothetical protein DSY2214 [Desulfitobacterium hafniense Y51]|uniref:Uncharacterized protein n=1 Tax=Desulfitobacterium hafniense (strain Y51) TaxID=138119 RepID=Q24VD9_DESHY|nr:hypothetical protein DSY2214 [Desulfitobacterium hafniense Y51]